MEIMRDVNRDSTRFCLLATLTYRHGFPLSHGRSDDVGAMDLLSVSVVLCLVKPFPGQVLQPASVSLSLSKLPERKGQNHWFIYMEILMTVI